MGRSISPMREAKLAGSDPPAAPRLIVPMSLRLAIPRRVALQQSSPPLHQPGVILKQKEQLGKENPLNGKCASSQLSQPRGSPQKPVLLKFTPSVNSCNIRFWGNRDRLWSRFPQGAPNESKRRPDHRDCNSISRNLCTAAWAGADARTFYL